MSSPSVELDDLLSEATPAELARVVELTRLARAETWADVARPDQTPPAGEWGTWVLLGGRGAGKTRALCEALRGRVMAGQSHRSALIAPTAADVRDVLIEGESGIMAVAGEARPLYEPSKRRLTWPNGALTGLYSADEPERLRGPQHDFAVCDELRAWRYLAFALDNLYLGLRLGPDPRMVAATTPGGMRELRDLLARPDVVVTHATTYANLENLSPRFRDRVVERYEGTRVGRAELYGEMIEDVEGALFSQAWIDDQRVSEPGAWLQRTVVGVDPAEGSGGSEQAYTVCALGADHQLYVLESVGMRESVATFARRCIEATARYSAEMVVEKNHGGAWLREVLESEQRAMGVVVPIRMVTASVGKRVRAEPVAALFEQRRVSVVGVQEALESQLCAFVQPGDPADRLDSMVWSISDLSRGGFGSSAGGEALPWNEGGSVAGGAVAWS